MTEETVKQPSSEPVRSGHWLPKVPTWNKWRRFWAQFWAIPFVTSVLAIVAGIALPYLDHTLTAQIPHVFAANSASALGILTTISTAMISITGLVFSITIVVLQLAASQFTPRILGTFLQSRVTQLTLGVFTGTFLYALTVLHAVRNTNEFIPQLAIGFAYVLVVTCIGFFLAFIQHITKSVFVTQVIRDISRTTFKTLDRMSPRSEEIDTTHQPNAWIKPEGVLETPLILHEGDDRLSDIDYHHLVAVSAHLDITIELDVQVGSFIASGTRIGTIYGNLKNPDETLERIRQGFVLSPQRSMRQDTAFGIRQLVDIAGRALSVGINDPLTAVEVVNALHAILTRVVTRPTPIPYVTDYQGNVRLIYKPQTARDLITLATTEIAGWGATSVIVTRQLRKMLRDLSAIALEEHQQPLRNATETVNALDQTPPIVRASTAIVE
ncbi:MAG: DUF2254 domain-containing protein [Acidobacteriota bacterium]|nr:DUF2254 domain-containing protein [Acidobacteriota bacterium]